MHKKHMQELRDQVRRTTIWGYNNPRWLAEMLHAPQHIRDACNVLNIKQYNICMEHEKSVEMLVRWMDEQIEQMADDVPEVKQ
jgi:hypothetical protein